MFDQPLSFLSGQSRFCGTRFIVRWAGGMQLKNALETGIQARFKGIEKRTPKGPFCHNVQLSFPWRSRFAFTYL